MPTSQETMDIKKAMAYDLLVIFESNGEKEYTAEELKAIINAYIAGLNQK